MDLDSNADASPSGKRNGLESHVFDPPTSKGPCHSLTLRPAQAVETAGMISPFRVAEIRLTIDEGVRAYRSPC